MMKRRMLSMSRSPVARRSDLVRIAVETMTERGPEPEFPTAAMLQLTSIAGPGESADPRVVDLRAMPWCALVEPVRDR